MKILIILCLAAICFAGQQKLDKKAFHYPGPKNVDAFSLDLGNHFALNPEKRSESESSEESGIFLHGSALRDNHIVLGFQGYPKTEKSVLEKEKSSSSDESESSSVSSSEESSQTSSKSGSSSEEAKAVNNVVSSSEENKAVADGKETSNDVTNAAAANPEVSSSEETSAAALNKEASSDSPEVSSGENNNAPGINEEASSATPEVSSGENNNAPAVNQEEPSSGQKNVPVIEGKNSSKQKNNAPNTNQNVASLPVSFLPFLRGNPLRDRRNIYNARPNQVRQVRRLNQRPLRSIESNIPALSNVLGRNKILAPQGGIEANKQKPRIQRKFKR